MWPNTKRLNIRSKSREFEGVSETIKTDRGEYGDPNTRNNNLTINLREMTFIDQNVLANKNLRPNKVVCKGKQSFQNLSHRFSHLDHLNHENIKLKNQVDELKKKVEDQQDEIIRLRKLQEDDLEAKLPTQCFTGDDSKALKFLIGKFKENFEKVKKSTQALPKIKEPLQGYKNLIEVLDRWSKEVIKADLNTKASYSMSTEEDHLLSSSRSKDTIDFERIPIEKIKFTGNLGVGSSSSVHKAIYEGEDVAVKKIFRGGEQGRELEKMFWKETSIMRKIRHPKIILFMGIAQTEDYYYIITEYMSKRSLDIVLKDQSVYLDTRIRLRIAIDIAKGLNFLHTLNPPVLHRDLKTANCLCNDHLEVKLADFGLAKLRDQNFSTNTIATVRYMAPEFIAKQVFGIKSDIFSFGMILWELFSRKEPFEELNPTQALYAIAVGKRPEIPKDMPDELRDVVIRCWDQDANLRPDCSQILQRLNEINEKFTY